MSESTTRKKSNAGKKDEEKPKDEEDIGDLGRMGGENRGTGMEEMSEGDMEE